MATVKALDPIRYGDKNFAPGETIEGLTNAQADELVAYRAAEIVERDHSAKPAAKPATKK